jgi:hypothetical protein
MLTMRPTSCISGRVSPVKSNGRNGFYFYDAEIGQTAMDRARLERELRAALIRDEFEVWYQTILDYAERFRQARAAGEQVIIDGNCLSACTMVIGMLPRDKVCATPKAVLGFHAAFRPTSDGRKVASTDATQFMMNTYPPELRKWISQRGGLTTQMPFLRGPELASFVPTCGTSVRAFGLFERLWR